MAVRQPDPREPGTEPERGFVVAVLGQGVDPDDELAELDELARTAGVEPVERLVQHRPQPDPRTYVGKGKLDQLKQAYGDAGAVTSNDGTFLARVRQIANHGGGANKYDNLVVGTNSRLDSLQAAVLRVKLRHLDHWNAERAERARAYAAALADVPGVIVPREREGARSVWHLFTVRARDRDRLQARLNSEGISTAIHYPKPLHLQPAMAAAGGRPGDLPVSEALTREVLCLPLYPELSFEDVARIASEVRSFCTAAVARA